MSDVIVSNTLFPRAGLSGVLRTEAQPPSEYAHLEGLVDLLNELVEERDIEERSEIAHLLERVLGYRDLELVPDDTPDEVLHWVDANVRGKRRISILVAETRSDVFTAAPEASTPPLVRQLLAHMEEKEIPWGLLGNGFRWQIYAREALLPELETLDIDLTPAVQAADEGVAVALLSLLSAGAAEPGGILDKLLEQEHVKQAAEARRWSALIGAAGSAAPALALWAELSGVSEKTPLREALTRQKAPTQASLKRALGKSLGHLPFLMEGEKTSGKSSVWAAIAQQMIRHLSQARPLAFSSLCALAHGMDQVAGRRRNSALPLPSEIRRILGRTAAGDRAARILLAGPSSLGDAARLFCSEVARRTLRGALFTAAIPETVQNMFAIEPDAGHAADLCRVLQLACATIGERGAYLSHRIRTGNPYASAAVSALGRAPATGKSRRDESGGARQLSFVEALFLDRLKTLASDLALISAAGPERIRSLEQAEGIFRRLARGVDRFRDLADLWLLSLLKEEPVSAGEYEIFVSNLREQDPEWEARIAPRRRGLDRLRKKLFPFHWELEFPELYVEGGGPRIDPGFHLIFLTPPPAQWKNVLNSLKAYHRTLAPVGAKPLPLQALTHFAGLFRTSRGTLLVGPLGSSEETGLRGSFNNNRRVISASGKSVLLVFER